MTIDVKRLGIVQEKAARILGDAAMFGAHEAIGEFHFRIHAVDGNEILFAVHGVRFRAIVTLNESNDLAVSSHDHSSRNA